MQMRVWTATHNGAVRKYNEDRCLARPDLGLFVVADGAGGHQSGDVASSMIVTGLDALSANLSGPALLSEVRRSIANTHMALRAEAAARGPATMIASTVVVLILRDGHFACLWAGDSRAYLFRHGVLQQISRDHSLVQELVDAGQISAAAAEHHPHANVITRAVGAEGADVTLDKTIGTIEPGDRFLLCSDGLTKTLADAELSHILGTEGLAAPAEHLIEAALARQVNDNVTAVVVNII